MISKKILLLPLVFGIIVLTGLVKSNHFFYGSIIDFYVFLLLLVILNFRLKSPKNKNIAEVLIACILGSWIIANLIDHRGDIFNRDFYIYPGLYPTLLSILGVLTGALIISKKKRIIGIICLAAISVFLFTKGKWALDKWQHYVNFNNFGEITPKQIEFTWNVDYDGRVLSNANNNIGDTLLVFDFWDSGCGACYRTMPIWDSIAEVTAQSPIMVVPVFIPGYRDSANTAQIILDKLKIKNLKPGIGNDPIKDNFHITGYPTIVILKNNQKLFYGNKDEALKWLSGNGYL